MSRAHVNVYVIQSDNGYRVWIAEDADHAVEQHNNAFPDEGVKGVAIAVRASSEHPDVKEPE